MHNEKNGFELQRYFISSCREESLHLLEAGQNRPFVLFAYLCRMIGEESVFLSFLYIKNFALDTEYTDSVPCIPGVKGLR